MKVDLRQLPPARLDFVRPMLARLVNTLPAGANWVYELKLDGYRTLGLKDHGVVTLFSRRGNIMNAPFPSIARAFKFVPDKTMLDGELVVLDERGNPSFTALQHSRFTPDTLYFYAFDLLAYQGRDLRKLTLIFIAKIGNGFTPALRREIAAKFAGLKTLSPDLFMLAQSSNVTFLQS